MGRFEHELREHEQERQWGILASLPRPARPRDDGMGGFLPLRDAAEAMGLAEAEVRDMARRGLLERIDVGGRVLVRPGIVTTLQVKTIA